MVSPRAWLRGFEKAVSGVAAGRPVQTGDRQAAPPLVSGGVGMLLLELSGRAQRHQVLTAVVRGSRPSQVVPAAAPPHLAALR